MNSVRNRTLCVALAIMLTSGGGGGGGGVRLSSAAYAAEIQAGPPSVTLYETVVGFGGYEWYVIGHNGSGAVDAPGTMTLLAKDHVFGESIFGANNNYKDSKLHEMMEGTEDTEGVYDGFPPDEQGLIKPRDLDGIGGAAVNDQYVWPLSINEYYYVYNDNNYPSGKDVLKHNVDWWLRSTSADGNSFARYVDSGGDDCDGPVDASLAVRPAFNLNLSSVIFTSASVGGKSTATAGSGLVGVTALTGTVKLTVLDRSQTLDVAATAEESEQSGSVLAFRYRNAPTGSNQYVSCVLMDMNAADALKYYGKLVSCDQVGSDSGTLFVPLSGVVDGDYTLEIFSEQANENYSTDFAGEAVTMNVVISDGFGTVSDFSGTMESVANAGNSHICGVFGGSFGVLGGLAAAGAVLARRKRRM